MPIPERRFEELAMDFVAKLTKLKGFDTILLMMDHLTGYVKLEPTHLDATAHDIANLVYFSWYRHFGLPKAITSDRTSYSQATFGRNSTKGSRLAYAC